MAKITDNTNEVIRAIDREIDQRLLESSIVVERKAKQKCPRRTGRLVRSITRRIMKRIAVIGTNVEYAPVVELGSKPHIIRPDKAQALWWKGLDHPVKVVHHPGTDPKPFLRPALEESKDEIEEIFNRKSTP